METKKNFGGSLKGPFLLAALYLFATFFTFNMDTQSARAEYSDSGQGAEMINRLGVGFSRQLMTNIPALSVKIQKSESLAIGALFGMRSTDSTQEGGYGAAVKLYRILFVEPQLRFYSSLLFGVISKTQGKTKQNGFQLDGTLGSEFHFPGLQSLGFSFEFGLSMNKVGTTFSVETVGYHVLLAAVHFYL